MQKYFLEQELESIKSLKTKTLNADEDVAWYRLKKSIGEAFVALGKEREDLANQAKEEGVVFLENGHPDMEKTDQEALKKATDKLNVIFAEDVSFNVLPSTLLNKLKLENDIEEERYYIMLNRYLKD